MTYEAAAQMEEDLAEDFCLAGYTVTGGQLGAAAEPGGLYP
jgi:hypothetical protein